MGFPDLPNGGVRCSTSYFTLLPIEDGESLQAGRFYEYSGNFIAPLDSASLSMAVGYGQHVWVDYIQLEVLHNGTPRENECTKDVSVNPETPCIFPFELLGNIVPFCSKTGYYSEGFGWCATVLNDDGISCLAGCEVQGETWDSCNHCADTTQDEDEDEDEDVPSCEPDRRTTMEGARCVFPFVYNGQRYTDCTLDPYDTWVDGFFPPTRPWCALDREAFRIGECAPCGDFEVSTSELEGTKKVTAQSALARTSAVLFSLYWANHHWYSHTHKTQHRAISAPRLFGGCGRFGGMGSQLRGDGRVNDGGRNCVFDCNKRSYETSDVV